MSATTSGNDQMSQCPVCGSWGTAPCVWCKWDVCERCQRPRREHYCVNFPDGIHVGSEVLICPTAVFTLPKKHEW